MLLLPISLRCDAVRACQAHLCVKRQHLKRGRSITAAPVLFAGDGRARVLGGA
jgi:hypothetical protein